MVQTNLPGFTPCSDPQGKPLLAIDIDGVISLFGFDEGEQPAGEFHLVDGSRTTSRARPRAGSSGC